MANISYANAMCNASARLLTVFPFGFTEFPLQNCTAEYAFPWISPPIECRLRVGNLFILIVAGLQGTGSPSSASKKHYVLVREQSTTRSKLLPFVFDYGFDRSNDTWPGGIKSVTLIID